MSKAIYENIFNRLVKASYNGNLEQEIKAIQANGDATTEKYVYYALGNGDPDKVVFQVNDENENSGENHHHEAPCLFDDIVYDMEGKVVIQDRNCSECGQFIDTCSFNNLIDKKEFIPLIDVLKRKEIPVYAIVAPAIIGQFGEQVTMGQLRSAFKHLGFLGMIEVAMFADILSLKEALEFDRSVHNQEDFVLTSCCCPVWVAMVKRVYHTLIPHILPSVSPMVACGRGIKRLHPEAKVVFIGPCIAKKAEAKEPDIRDAVDAVLTFEEVQQIFEATGINPIEMEDIPSEHSSTGRRIYARTGGVSKAISDTLDQLRPDKPIRIKAVQANGARECKELLQAISNGDITANFYEGMGCKGGCVGGPKALLKPELGTIHVNAYGLTANALTPVNNPYVMELLNHLGIEDVDSLLEGESAAIFQRQF